jgi:leucyl/phenylalanyl-tRNA--protein transferase
MRLSILHAGHDEPFPPVASALRDPNGLLAAGGDLTVARLLDAYRHGIFPWFSPGEPILWWSPDPRLVFDTRRVHVPRRLARWLRRCRWRITADRAFREVMLACAADRPGQPGTWIGPDMLAAYQSLHEAGHAHSIEVRDGDRLVGGLYGVAIGRMVYGESMFSDAGNGSKVALLAACRGLDAWQVPLLDAQVVSSHLLSLGAHSMTREAFCTRVADLVARDPLPVGWNRHFGAIAVADLARASDGH